MSVVSAITIVQGDNFRPAFRIGTRTSNSRPIIPTDLTGASAKLQVRVTEDSVTPSIDASTAGGTITITGPDGLIEVNVPGTSTASLLGSYVWDLEITYADGVVQTPVSGTLTVTRGVTRGV